MKSETPAKGILKRNNYGNSMLYQVACECGDSNHDHNLWVEADDGNITVTIYTTAKSKWWEINRWRKIWTLITKGYIEYEASLIIDKQVALNYADVLKSAIKDCEKFEAERMKRKSNEQN
jgi:hypothetical protein